MKTFLTTALPQNRPCWRLRPVHTVYVHTCPVQIVHVSATRSQQRPSHVDMRWDTWSVLVLAGGWRVARVFLPVSGYNLFC